MLLEILNFQFKKNTRFNQIVYGAVSAATTLADLLPLVFPAWKLPKNFCFL